MAFTPDTLSAVAQSIGGGGIRMFTYETDDAIETVTGSGYFTIGKGMGLRVSDIIFVSSSASSETYTLVVGSVSATGAATASVSDFERDFLVTPQMYGAKGDGTTDDTAAFQRTIDAVLARGGGEIYIPTGTYWFAQSSASLDPGNGNITFRGAGNRATVLRYDEGDGAQVSDLTSKALFKNNTTTVKSGSVVFMDIGFQGIHEDGQVRGGGVPVWLDYYKSVRFIRTRHSALRQMGMDIHFCGSFWCIDSEFEDIAADAIRVRDTPNCIIRGNTVLRNGDDAIAVHTSDAALVLPWPTREGIVIAENIITNAGLIRVLGARRATVSGNILNLTRGGVSIAALPSFSEGNIPIFDIGMFANSITNTVSFASTSLNSIGAAITVSCPRPRAGTVGIPGDHNGSAIIYPWDYAEVDTDDSNQPVGPLPGIRVVGNYIGRTDAPAVAAFSDYGFGSILYQGVAYDPAVTDALLRQNVGLGFYCGLKNAVISDNQISHLSNGLYFDTPTSDSDYQDVLVSNNNIYDCIVFPIRVASAALTADIIIKGNLIDGDPHRLAPNSNIDGTYDASAVPFGINTGDTSGLTVIGNRFKNVTAAFQTNVVTHLVRDNEIWCGTPAAIGAFNTGNKGVGLIPAGGQGYRHVIYNADLTGGTPRRIVTAALSDAAAMPATGTWVVGTFVRNSGPAIDASNMVILGWLRLTTGTGHVAGTDWAVVRVSHVSPAT